MSEAARKSSSPSRPFSRRATRLRRTEAMARAPLEQLQAGIGYQFRKTEWLREALTHSSLARESHSGERDNERLEFLGDAVLNYLVTVRLMETFPKEDEGQLSLARAGLVSAAHLEQVAAEIHLGRYLRLGPSEERTGGRSKAGLLVNAVEALIAAIYCDAGLEPAQAFVERFVVPPGLASSPRAFSAKNYKGALQEHLQAQRWPAARYRIVEEAGEEHRKIFTVEVRAGAKAIARGTGASKKAAEQEAARLALDLLSAKTNG